jgi:2-methylcitrate dehydratase PrpD
VTTPVPDDGKLPTGRLLAPLLERCAIASTPARRAAARSLFDYLACVAAAPSIEIDWACEPAGRLAFAAHLRDQDDLHHDSVTHPGGIVWSAVIATGLEREVTWARAVEAALLGYELVVRLAEGFPDSHRRQWHATTVAGTIGAAAAAAHLLGGRSAVLDAIGHASSVASGSAQAQAERTATRLVHRAFAASTGLLCARAAAADLKGNHWGLQGDRGAFGSVSTTIAAAVLAERRSFALEETGARLYPVNGFAHAAVEAAGSLGPAAPEEIERVTVTVAPPAAVALASNAAPATDDDAWWSIEHAVALALMGGGSSLAMPGLSHRPEVLRVCARTRVYAGGDGWGAKVVVDSPDGQSRVASVSEPLGHVRRPASDEDLCEKWLRLTGSDGRELLQRLYAASPTASLASLVPISVTSSVHRSTPGTKRSGVRRRHGG